MNMRSLQWVSLAAAAGCLRAADVDRGVGTVAATAVASADLGPADVASDLASADGAGELASAPPPGQCMTSDDLWDEPEADDDGCDPDAPTGGGSDMAGGGGGAATAASAASFFGWGTAATWEVAGDGGSGGAADAGPGLDAAAASDAGAPGEDIECGAGPATELPTSCGPALATVRSARPADAPPVPPAPPGPLAGIEVEVTSQINEGLTVRLGAKLASSKGGFKYGRPVELFLMDSETIKISFTKTTQSVLPDLEHKVVGATKRKLVWTKPTYREVKLKDDSKAYVAVYAVDVVEKP